MSTISDRLDLFAEARRPDKGDKLIGEVIDVDRRVGDYGAHPVVTIRDASGREHAVHVFHAVAKSELASVPPEIGGEIAVAYPGEHPQKKYGMYKVLIAKATTAAVDWDEVGREAPGEVGEPEPFGPTVCTHPINRRETSPTMTAGRRATHAPDSGDAFASAASAHGLTEADRENSPSSTAGTATADTTRRCAT